MNEDDFEERGLHFAIRWQGVIVGCVCVVLAVLFIGAAVLLAINLWRA